MKTIGIIGGLTWVSTIEYYRLVNEMVQTRLGGSTSAKLIMYSVNFDEIVKCKLTDDWDGIATIIADAAKKIASAGAGFLLIGANTMHHIFDAIQASVNIPIIHIADATAKAIQEKGIRKVALLGTKYTMQFDFYKNKLLEYGIETLIPNEAEIQFINNSIYEELGKNIFLTETKSAYLQIIDRLVNEGAEGVILGCTEIPLLINDGDCNVPMFNTGYLHAKAAVDFALA